MAYDNVELVGPFTDDRWYLSVEGCKVPNLYMRKNGDVFTIIFDDRFAMDTNEDEINRWGWLFANAMAVSAGYTKHGFGSAPLNKYGVGFTKMNPQLLIRAVDDPPEEEPTP